MTKHLVAFCAALALNTLAYATPASALNHAAAPALTADQAATPEPSALQLFSAESIREFQAEQRALDTLARTELRVISGSVKGDEARYVVASARTRCTYDMQYRELPAEAGALVGLWMVNKSNCKPLKGGH